MYEKKFKIVLMNCLIVSLVGCTVVQQTTRVSAQTVLSESKAYLGGLFESSFGIFRWTVYFRTGETTYNIDLTHEGEPTLAVVELPPGEYTVGGISVYYDFNWHSVEVPDSLRQPVRVIPGQILYIGNIAVEYVYRIFLSPFDVHHNVDHAAFEKKLVSSYEIPSNMHIVSIGE